MTGEKYNNNVGQLRETTDTRKDVLAHGRVGTGNELLQSYTSLQLVVVVIQSRNFGLQTVTSQRCAREHPR